MARSTGWAAGAAAVVADDDALLLFVFCWLLLFLGSTIGLLTGFEVEGPACGLDMT